MPPPHLLVIGGNGFVGSSVCRSAIARGWRVTSLSRSGSPFVTREGYSPAWTKAVDWRAGTPFEKSSYAPLLGDTTAVVSTLGILLEGEYKVAGEVKPAGVIKGLVENLLGGRGNPLRRKTAGKEEQGMSYERMNRDAALAILEALVDSVPTSPTEDESTPPRSPFIYLSAEDIFRPFVSSRYIETKRETERTILEILKSRHEEGAPLTGRRQIRPVFIRPSLIYHPHLNPLSTLPATFLNVSSSLQSILPSPLRASHIFPSLSSNTSALPPSSTSFAALLTIPPIHVDTVAEAICRAVEDEGIEGVVGVRKMREMQGFDSAFDREGEGEGTRTESG